MRGFYRLIWGMLPVVLAASCEALDDDPAKHVGTEDYVALHEVAEVLAAIPIGQDHLEEVYSAVTSSSSNGYDEEYTMGMLFDSPGAGVGEDITTRSGDIYEKPLRSLIAEHVRSAAPTKSGGKAIDPERWLEELMTSDIQIYWPYSENWDGEDLPVITFDPEDESEVNTGYRLVTGEDGKRLVEEVIVDEEMAKGTPVWVVNRNSDADFRTLEMLRKEDPSWGDGGGEIIISPQAQTKSDPIRKALILRKFKAKKSYDCWFAGASEFFVKVGALEGFTASTEAELRLYNPSVIDFVVVVRRGQIGENIPFDAMLVSDWTDQMTHCACIITEDDGGPWTGWKCTALVRIASKSYGIELNLPVRVYDDIVWRGRLAWDWLEANSGMPGHFGDVDLTFEVQEY